MTSGDVIAHSVSLTAESTLDLNVDGFGLGSAQIAILDAQSLASVTVHGGSITSDTDGITLHATSTVTAHSTPTSDANKDAADQDGAVASVTIRSDAYAKVYGDALIHSAGDVSLIASNTVDATAIADGSKGGAGATFGLGLVFTNTEASIGGAASVDQATALSLGADSHNTLEVLAKSTPRGADDGGSETHTQKGLADPNQDGDSKDAAGTSEGNLTLAGALAVSGVGSTTHAGIDTTGEVTTSGALLLSATSENTSSATADGTSIIDAGFDAASKIDDSNDTIQLATGHGLHTGDKVTYHHGDGGTDVGDLEDGKQYYVRVVSGDKVELYDTQDNAKTGASGKQDLAAATGGEQSLELDGSATGVSVAVAINVASVDATATLASDVTAASATLKALVNDNKFSASATSGAGDASKTGFAGSLAINIGITSAAATIADGVSLTLTGGSGDVSLVAHNHVTNGATASASQEGSAKTGVGASVALNIGETDTNALVGDDAALTGAHDLKLEADSANALSTSAEGGAKGGTAVTPVVAISVADNDTNAKLGSVSAGSTLLTGALDAAATHAGSVETEAKGDTKSADTGVGISIALGVAVDRATATTARSLEAGGAVAFRARSTSFADTKAKASSAGGEDAPAESKDSDQGGGVDNAVHNQSKFADQRGAASGGKGGAAGNTDGKSSAEGPSGQVQVAGAVGITVAVSDTEASIPDALEIKAGTSTSDGALTLRAENNTDAAAAADASAVVINVQSFDATSGKDVDATADTITLHDGHGLKSGDKVTCRGADDIGLEDKSTYYVNISGNTAKLYDTAEHAKAGKSGDGSGLEDSRSARATATAWRAARAAAPASASASRSTWRTCRTTPPSAIRRSPPTASRPKRWFPPSCATASPAAPPRSRSMPARRSMQAPTTSSTTTPSP